MPSHFLFAPFYLQKVEYTLGEELEGSGPRLLPSEELNKQLEKLLQEGSTDEQVFDWIEVWMWLGWAASVYFGVQFRT